MCSKHQRTWRMEHLPQFCCDTTTPTATITTTTATITTTTTTNLL